MNEHSIISSMINKYAFSHFLWSFWHIHMIGIYTICSFLTCLCIQGDFLTTYCTYIIYKRGKSCVWGVLISRSCMRVFPNSNKEWTPPPRQLGPFRSFYITLGMESMQHARRPHDNASHPTRQSLYPNKDGHTPQGRVYPRHQSERPEYNHMLHVLTPKDIPTRSLITLVCYHFGFEHLKHYIKTHYILILK